jgi:hypothetical protein
MHGARGPFSFSPCKPAKDPQQAVFERPGLKKLFAGLRLASTGQKPSLDIAQPLVPCVPHRGSADEFWQALVELVLGQGLSLGVRFSLPDIKVLGSRSVPPPPDSCGNIVGKGKKRSAA